MSTSAYNGVIISVRTETGNPVVNVVRANDGAVVLSLSCTANFSCEADAEAYGLELGEKWIENVCR